MEFLQQVKEQDTWQLGLTMFMDSPRESQILRVYALDVVNASILRRRDGSDPETLGVIQETLMKYIHSVYGPGSGEVDNAPIQNKLTQAITYLFLATYGASWSSFFDELLSITTTSNGGTLEGRQRDNLPGVVFYLRVVASVHDEIADVLVARTAQDQQRNGLLKDQIRERDVKKLIDSWKEILTVWKDKNDDIVEMTLKVMGKWVSWVNIAFVLDHDFVNFLWSLLACSGKVKEAAVDTLAEIVGKKMDSSDKFQLIEFMNFVDMLAGFLSQDPALQAGPQLDVDYAEKVAKLVDNVGSELIRCLDLVCHHGSLLWLSCN